MRYTAFFNRSATFRTKNCTLRESKTTIQAPFYDSCSHLLDFAIDANCNINWSSAFKAKIRMFRELETTIQAPFSDSCTHLLILFYRLGLYLFSAAHSNQT